MANKTIHELNQAATVTGSHEFAVYDTSNSSTQRASLAQIFDDNEILWADDEDEPISTDPVDFESADELNPTDTENVTLLTGTDSWSQRFQKISQMFKNIRFILGKLGTTDISNIGNGTVTGALSELNSNLNSVESKTINISSNYTSSIAMSGGGVHCFQRGDKTALVFGTFTVNTAISAAAAADMFTGFPLSVGGTMWVTVTHVPTKETIRMQFRNGSSSGVLQQNYTAYAAGEYIINPFFYYVTI